MHRHGWQTTCPRFRATAKTRTLPWWLAGGTERCDVREHCVTVDRETGEAPCHGCAARARKEDG
ncbi:MAG TPA: hypothetical protein VFR37_15030 [Longimicrobium sp.]|nr:hypothetical protein [Longimicrobium sp.]